MKLRILIVDGYTKAAREQLVAGGASMAADLYTKMLRRCSPCKVESNVCFASDPDAVIPNRDSIVQYDGIAWTGCSLGCNDGSQEVAKQIQLQQDAYAAGVPGFGSCWAAQIAVAAAGGKVQANPRGREMGIARKICLTPEGRGHPLHEGRATVFDGFTSHDDEITHIPAGALVLSGNAWTRVQSVWVRHDAAEFWGLQYHPEYDLHELARLTYCRIAKLMKHGFFRDEKAALAYVEDLEALHSDPTRKDIAWKLGIDADVMDEDVRCVEVRNWIKRLVIPNKLGQGR